jgi:hypothetical protein
MENTMVHLKYLKTTCFVAAASTILLITGCQSSDTQQAESDAAHSQAEITETARLEHTQMAAGARADCTLYGCHFDGANLSSLGTSALDLVLADPHRCNPLVVYLAVPEDTYAQDRRLAIGHYLEDKGGLKPEQIEFQPGPNPATFHATDTQLGYYPKTDTSTDGAGASAAGSSGTGH